MMPLFQI